MHCPGNLPGGVLSEVSAQKSWRSGLLGNLRKENTKGLSTHVMLATLTQRLRALFETFDEAIQEKGNKTKKRCRKSFSCKIFNNKE